TRWKRHALEASDVEGSIVLKEAQVQQLVVNREPVDPLLSSLALLARRKRIERLCARRRLRKVRVPESWSEPGCPPPPPARAAPKTYSSNSEDVAVLVPVAPAASLMIESPSASWPSSESPVETSRSPLDEQARVV
ncbi:hypothetical protein RTBOTA2_003345, partial [Rhodotorula toruloides]